ncbi:hypothetical protein ES703_94485 [subsurface metagenome]
MLQSYYNEVSRKSIQTGAIIAYESAGDFLRWNSHWHGLVLEGGFDEEGNNEKFALNTNIRWYWLAF